MKHIISKKLIITPNSKVKETIKSDMMKHFADSQTKKSTLKSYFLAHQPAFLSSLMFILFVGTFLTYNLLPTPLKADQVIAGALQAIDENQSNGKWQYTKTKEETTYGDKVVVTYTENWNNTDFIFQTSGTEITDENMIPNSFYKVTLADGRILNEYVSLNGKSYERDTRDTYKDVMGYDPYDTSIYENMEFVGPPGFEEAGLTIDDMQKLSMKEIDDRLIAAGQKPFNSPMYKSTDFPAYTMTPQELEAYYKEHENEDPAVYDTLYGGSDNFIQQDIAYTPDGEMLSGEEAKAYNEKQQAIFETQDRLRNGSLEEKKAALKKLQDSDNVTLIRDAKWDGKEVIGIDLSSVNGGADMSSMSQLLYLDPKTYQIVGEEYSFDIDNELYTGALAEITPTKVKVSYLQQFTTETEPNFSIEGLVPSEELHNFTAETSTGL